MSKGNKKFEIPDPAQALEKAVDQLSKYKIGAEGLSFYHIRNLQPVFAFDFMSLLGTNLCFNCPTKTRDDLLGFLEGLKKVSTFTYDAMTRTPPLRFHSVDLNASNVSIKPKDFLIAIAPSGRGITEDQLPTLYQFDLQYNAAARAFGFLYKGVFYIVWYDRDHIIYSK